MRAKKETHNTSLDVVYEKFSVSDSCHLRKRLQNNISHYCELIVWDSPNWKAECTRRLKSSETKRKFSMLQKEEKNKPGVRYYLPLSMATFPSRKTLHRWCPGQCWEIQGEIKQELHCSRTNVWARGSEEYLHFCIAFECMYPLKFVFLGVYVFTICSPSQCCL